MDINIYGTLLVTKFYPDTTQNQVLDYKYKLYRGHKGASCETACSMSKGAINQLTSSLGRELGPSGIRTMGIAHSFINTYMNENLELAEFIEAIPLKRPGEAKEITSLIIFFNRKGFLCKWYYHCY